MKNDLRRIQYNLSENEGAKSIFVQHIFCDDSRVLPEHNFMNKNSKNYYL